MLCADAITLYRLYLYLRIPVNDVGFVKLWKGLCTVFFIQWSSRENNRSPTKKQRQRGRVLVTAAIFTEQRLTTLISYWLKVSIILTESPFQVLLGFRPVETRPALPAWLPLVLINTSGVAIRSPATKRASGCWDRLPRARCDVMMLIKERGRASADGSSVWFDVVGRQRLEGVAVRRHTAWLLGRRCPAEWSGKDESERLGWWVGGWWGEIPRCSALPCLNVPPSPWQLGPAGVRGSTHTWRKQKTSFAFCTQHC